MTRVEFMGGNFSEQAKSIKINKEDNIFSLPLFGHTPPHKLYTVRFERSTGNKMQLLSMRAIEQCSEKAS